MSWYLLAEPLAKSGEAGKSGPIGLAVILLLCVACYFLFKSMSKHLRKVREEFPVDDPPPHQPPPEPPAQPAPQPAAEAAESDAASGQPPDQPVARRQLPRRCRDQLAQLGRLEHLDVLAELHAARAARAAPTRSGTVVCGPAVARPARSSPARARRAGDRADQEQQLAALRRQPDHAPRSR